MPVRDPFEPFGIARTAELVRAGLSRQQVARRVASGHWTRPARGWISNGAADPAVEAAVRSGAALSCISALRRRGIWTPLDATVHLRHADGRVRHRERGARDCAPMGPPLPIHLPVDGLRVALEAAGGCLAPDDLTAVLDSVLNRGLASVEDLREWFDRYPRAVREAVARADSRAESGTESLVRLRLRRRRVKLRTQVQIAGVGRVDLLVGDRLVVEIDSKAHHTSLAAYQTDRTRDRALRAAGYHVIRLTYDDVMHRWQQVETDLLAMIRRHDHRWPRTRSRESGPSCG